MPITSVAFVPKNIDAKIGDEFNKPQFIYVDRAQIVDQKKGRNQLVIFFPGTNGAGHGGKGFCELAATLGFHAMSLTYNTSIPATVCSKDPDVNAHEAFRMACLQGGESKYLTVSRAESMENRLITWLQRLGIHSRVYSCQL